LSAVEARYKAISATSTVSPERPKGVRSIIGPNFPSALQILRLISVKTTVGQIALTCMLIDAQFFVIPRVIAFITALDAE